MRIKPIKEITIDSSTLSSIDVLSTDDIECINITSAVYTLTRGIVITSNSRIKGQEYTITYDGSVTIGTGGSINAFGRTFTQSELDESFVMKAIYTGTVWVTMLVSESDFSTARVFNSGGTITLQYKLNGVWTDTSTTWEI